MSTEQFDYILDQIEHLIYKPTTDWWHSISAEEKLAICIIYLYKLSFKSIKHVHRCLCIILYINIYEFVQFLMIINYFYINYNISFVTSRYLATGDAMITIAYNFWTGVATARQIILDVCLAILDVLSQIYLPVPSEDKWKSIAGEFYERWNSPNCIGAIDGKHVMMQCPFNSGSLFYNYKSYFSIVLLASCCLSRL